MCYPRRGHDLFLALVKVSIVLVHDLVVVALELVEALALQRAVDQPARPRARPIETSVA